MGRIATGIKSLALPSGVYSWGNWVTVSRERGGLAGERSYRENIGDGADTSIVAGCVNFIMRTFPEAPPGQWQLDAKRKRTREWDAPMISLLESPTFDPRAGRSYYDGTVLWMATLASFTVDGNAYWLKIRNRFGEPIQLWYVPHWMIEPRRGNADSDYLDHYDYRPFGKLFELPPSEIVHFRFGLDQENPLKGSSPLRGELRSIFTDEEAARYTASLLRNNAIPGVIISPKEVESEIGDDEAEAVKLKFMQKFGKDRLGEPMVMQGAVDVVQVGWNPDQLDMGKLRDIPEERITTALGLPAAVVGFGAGLHEAHTNATMKELREAAWESNLIPTGRILSGTVKEQLMNDFVVPAQIKRTTFAFDLSQVRVLQDDENKKAERWKTLVGGRIARVDEARSAFDLPTTPADEVYLEPISVTAVGKDGLAIEPPEPPAPTPALPGATPPALPPGIDPNAGKAFMDALRELREAALRMAADGRRDDQIRTLVAAMEKAAREQNATTMEGLTALAKAIAERPIQVAVLPAETGFDETREVLARDAKDLTQKIRIVRVPSHSNGNGA